MKRKECRYKEACEAQLCPMDEDIDNYVFYADEEVCKNMKFRNLHWINRQMALRKKYKKSSDIGCFNKGMLEVLGRVTHKTRGLKVTQSGEQTPEDWVRTYRKKKSSRVQVAVIKKSGHKDIKSYTGKPKQLVLAP